MPTSKSDCIVLKFGGAAVTSATAFSHIADIVIQHRQQYKKIVVVVSAMGNTTDSLLDLAKQINPNPPHRELDMLLSVGERISMALLAMALAAKDVPALSFTGSQSGILTTNDHTDAKIVAIRPTRLLPSLDAGKIVIVAGFQGMSQAGEITTLGRGGSDTTAVALAVALDAEKVEFFKDVDGIYDKDPKYHADAQLLPTLTYVAATEIIRSGAKILHGRCLALAQKNALPLAVLPFAKKTSSTQVGTIIQDSNPPPSNKLFEV